MEIHVRYGTLNRSSFTLKDEHRGYLTDGIKPAEESGSRQEKPRKPESEDLEIQRTDCNKRIAVASEPAKEPLASEQNADVSTLDNSYRITATELIAKRPDLMPASSRSLLRKHLRRANRRS